MIAALAAHRWRATALVCGLLSVVAYLARDDVVQLPFADDPVPARMLVAMTVVAASVTPLYATFPGLVLTFVRERSVRAVRPAGVVILAMIGFLPAVVGSPEAGRSALIDTALFLSLLAAGILAAVALGDHAWFVVTGASLTVLFLEALPGAPVAAALAGMGLAPPAAAVVVACAIYAVRGPRAGRRA